MNGKDLESAFNRALLHSFSRSKALLVFPALVLCGILIVFCRALSFGASEWMSMSLAFLPVLLGSGVMLSVGVLVIRLYQHEVKNLQLGIKKLVTGSLDVVLGTSYLSVPPILAYLLLWIILGIFFLLKEIPGLGSFFSTILSFGPFLLIFCSMLLCLFNLALLFFVAPAAARLSSKRLNLARAVLSLFQKRMFQSMRLFFIALIPIGLFVGLLSWAAILTNLSFSTDGGENWTLSLKWFFLMLPFAAILTPAVIFFFNFASESHQLLNEQ
ncbi:MAG: hypothetical protein JSS32_07240 [Verrucomicrobia bacterium]|nr:hypothetical protein [Verrucomicrobiota bacterium]